MKTITVTMPAWAGPHMDPTKLDTRDPASVINALHLFQPHNEKSWIADGTTKVGEATITLTLINRDDLVKNKVESLRAEKAKTLADAQAKATAIEGQIQSLLAITFDEPAEVQP